MIRIERILAAHRARTKIALTTGYERSASTAAVEV